MFTDERAREGDDSALYEVPGAHTGKKSKHLGVLYSYMYVYIYMYILCA